MTMLNPLDASNLDSPILARRRRGYRNAFVVLILSIIALALTGCKQADYVQGCAILAEAEVTAADFEVIFAGQPEAEKIAEMRKMIGPVKLVVCARAQDPNAGDPSAELQALLDAGLHYASQIKDEKVRQRVIAYVVSIRLALRVAGVLKPNPPPPPPTTQPAEPVT